MTNVAKFFDKEAIFAPYGAWLVAIKTNPLDCDFASAAPALLPFKHL